MAAPWGAELSALCAGPGRGRFLWASCGGGSQAVS